MKKAKIFETNCEREVDAWDIRNGLVSRECSFVDLEYEFRVIYVNSSKNNGAPHFRLYLSHKDYLALTSERKREYDYLRGLEHFDESAWHKKWTLQFENIAETEKYIKNPKTKKYKRADVYLHKNKIVLEFQHSYISMDFKKRNAFYKLLGITVVWLFDLTDIDGKDRGDVVEILENNSYGFFRVAEEENNVFSCPVFIQLRNNIIYRVEKLYRKEISNSKESTVRFFDKTMVASEEQFISAVQNNLIWGSGESLFEIWARENHNGMKAIIVRYLKNGKLLKFHKDKTGGISENYSDGCLGYTYCDFDKKTGKYFQSSTKFYSMRKEYAKLKDWVLLDVKR